MYIDDDLASLSLFLTEPKNLGALQVPIKSMLMTKHNQCSAYVNIHVCEHNRQQHDQNDAQLP